MQLEHQKKKPSCPICNAPMIFSFLSPGDYRRPSDINTYNVYWCQKCAFGNIWERPTPKEVESFYEVENYYTHSLNAKDDTGERDTLLDRIRVHLAWRLDSGKDFEISEVTNRLPKSILNVCEIGCGNGSNLVKFSRAGHEVFGIEPDESARKVAKESINHIYAGTAENLPAEVSGKLFDVILMSHVLEHCVDINKALANVTGLLKDEGLYVVEVPNCASLSFKRYQEMWPWTDIPRHLNFFTLESLKKLCKQHGFSIISIAYRGFCRQFTTAWLREEKIIWTALQKAPKIQPNFKFRSVLLLLRALLMSKTQKYDSVRIIFKKS